MLITFRVNNFLFYTHYAYFFLDFYVYSVYNIITGGDIIRAREMIKLLSDDGWEFVKQVGSHRHYKHPSKPGKVTVPIHTGDIDLKTAKSILKQAGLS